jgi:hypothetical protein
MRALTIGLIAIAVTASAAAQQPVQRKGYIRSDGTYVAPSYSTKPNGTTLDNYSTKGNYNPYSGKAGTVDPYKAPSYGSTYKPYKAPKSSYSYGDED